MQMYCISIFKSNSLIKIIQLDHPNVYSIGRHSFNDIYLKDPSCKVSRFHAALYCDSDLNYYLQDLGSRNGSYIHGKKTDYACLKIGDKINIGGYDLIFDKLKNINLKDKSTIIPIEDESINLKTKLTLNSNDYKNISNKNLDFDSISLLYKISHISNTCLDFNKALDQILYNIYQKYSPDRIFAAIFESDSDRINCIAQFPFESTDIFLSKSMLKYLLQEKSAYMTNDASKDIRFKNGEKYSKSILKLKINSALCVPLELFGETKGFLYMDNSEISKSFSQEDVAFMSLIGQELSSFLERNHRFSQYNKKILSLENSLSINTNIIGISSGIRKTLNNLESILNTDTTILITGESGTGKDLIAKYIHDNSKRKGMPYIEINCAAIPVNLLETEMFGVIANYPGFHNTEALTGKFQKADNGTIFLNEIGDLPVEIQAKLLDVIEKKVIWPLGLKKPIKVNIRIIAATNHNLENDINEKKFRADLFERLNVFSIHLPPLRERQEDIPLLCGYFLFLFRNEYNKRVNNFSNSCIQDLSTYYWPRNIRELKNSIERAIILTKDRIITADLFNLGKSKITKLKSLDEIEKEHIINILEYTDGNKEKASKILGISKQTLYNKIENNNIDIN